MVTETSNYSAGYDTFTDKEAKRDKVSKSHINKIQNAIEAMQAALGLAIEGDLATLAARLAIMIDTSGSLAYGSSFPGSPVARQLFFKSDEDVVYARNNANGAWFKVGENLSNVIYSWAGMDNAGGNISMYRGTDQSPNALGSNYLFYAVISTNNYRTIFNFRWTKISGVNTVTILCRIWTNGAGNASCRVDIGGQNGSCGTVSAGTPTQASAGTVDVSGLSDGTTYDVTVQLHNSDTGGNSLAYLSSIILEGS